MNTKKYRVIITPTARKEINKIYDYIFKNLYAENAAKNLMKQVEAEIQNLKLLPKIHSEIVKIAELQRTYRKIVIKNYIILYTIDEDNCIVYISHMYYRGRDYINNDLL